VKTTAPDAAAGVVESSCVEHITVSLNREACDDGDASACAEFRARLWEGDGVPRDVPGAVRLYEAACDAGDEDACTHLGDRFFEGQGVAKDARRAVKLYQRACNAGAVEACAALAERFFEGRGVRRDVKRAAKLQEAGLVAWCDDEQGGPDGQLYACQQLVDFYLEGRGVPRNPAKAASILEHMCGGLGMHMESMGEAAPVEWVAEACTVAAEMHCEGRGIPKNVGRANELCAANFYGDGDCSCEGTEDGQKVAPSTVLGPECSKYVACCKALVATVPAIKAGCDAMEKSLAAAASNDAAKAAMEAGCKQSNAAWAQMPDAPVMCD
jgi:hypothetical protein